LWKASSIVSAFSACALQFRHQFGASSAMPFLRLFEFCALGHVHYRRHKRENAHAGWHQGENAWA
jgi:hypothetical protein